MPFKNIILLLIFSLSVSVLIGCTPKPTPAVIPIPKVVQVQQTDRGVEFTLEEMVTFDSGKTELNAVSKEILDKMAEVIKIKTTKPVLIEGHTDNVGSVEANNRLSERRALAIKTYLVSKGVDAKRVSIKGFGHYVARADNSSAEGRRLNRRAEIIIIGEKKEVLGNDLEDILNDIWRKFKQFVS